MGRQYGARCLPQHGELDCAQTQHLCPRQSPGTQTSTIGVEYIAHTTAARQSTLTVAHQAVMPQHQKSPPQKRCLRANAHWLDMMHAPGKSTFSTGVTTLIPT